MRLQIHETAHGLGNGGVLRRLGWLVALQKIDGLHAEPPKTVLDFDDDGVRTQADIVFLAVLHTIVGTSLVLPPNTAFGGDDHLIAPALDGSADHFLAVSPTVGRRGVDECDATVDGCVDSLDGFVVVRGARPDRRRTQSDDGGVDS